MTALRPMKLLQVDPASTPASVEVGVDRASGGASVQVPIPLTPGRDGFGPQLALAFGGYDPLSAFPHGWSLSGLPSIDIDTRDGLPAYDGRERFRFQGQDLIPLDDVGRSSAWARGDYDVRAFRARIETVPIRAEQWTERSTGRVHWRVRTGDGTVQVFGRRADDESRLADPEGPRRTFRWLFEAAYDRLGNAMLVRYEGEDDAGVERPSLDAGRFAGATANRYPKRILYGNAAPLAEDDDTSAAEWHFESVFDYGDHDALAPQPQPSAPWLLRQDVGFSARLGFELRTRRLCRRVLMFHRFPTELGEPSTLVGSLELDLDEAADATTLSGVRYVGWRTEAGARVSEATPWATFQYTNAGTEDAFEVLEAPLLGEQTQLVDLFGEGLPGLLTMDGGGARFASNLGGGAFGAHQPLPEWPTGLEGATLADFDGDGNVELVQLTGSNAGYYRLDRRSRRWESLKRFAATLNVDPQQGGVLSADLSGDGRPDLVLLHGSGLTWFPNQGPCGFGDPIEVRLPPEKLPVANRPLDRFLADMTGDGLADIVEVLNGSVRYWPNLGRGQFGAPVVMDDAPRLDSEGRYDAARVLLVDLDQTGTADLVYLRGDGVVLRASNRRGTSFGALTPIAWGPSIPNGARLELADVYGDGSRCLVWTAPSASGAAAFHVLRLVSAPGAGQIQAVTHPLGATTELEWGHSVRHYLRDVESGRGWDRPLPAQHPVVDVLRRTEPIDGQEQSERFVYHDGHYDPRERSFALFAVVDHFDVDTARPALDVIPLMTRRFSHTGEVDYSKRFARHHYAGDLSPRPPPESDVQGSLLLTSDLEEAFRALMGTPAREEVYATDPQGIPAEHPFHTTRASHRARVVRGADAQFRTGAQVIPQDTLVAAYEQSADDSRQTLQRVLEVDAYLTPVLAMEAGLPRGEMLARFDAQGRLLARASRGCVVHLDTPERFELAIPVESWTYEVRVPTVDDAFAESLANELSTACATANANAYDQPLDPLGNAVAARELTHDRVFYWDDARTSALPFESVGLITLPHHTEHAAYDRGQLVSVFGTRIDLDIDLPAMGYAASGDVFYQQGPITRFGGASSFYRLEETEAFDGGVQRVVSDAHHLVAQQAIDEVGNTTTADIDYHVLAPWRLIDPNGSVQEIDYDPLGVARRASRYGTAMDASGALVAHGFGALTRGQPRPTFDAALAAPEAELGTAESLFVYEFASGGQPMRTLSLSAEQFVDRGPDAGSAPARAQVAVTYLDGFGRELQQRTLVEPGLAWTEDATSEFVEAQVSTRWRVSGHVVLDDKQQPTEQYEPFFRDAAEFEPELPRRQFGVASTTHYDALGRTVRQNLPNDTFTETHFAAWSQTTYDPNDTVARATDYRDDRESLPTTDPERRALDQALSNAETPVSVHLDALGREIATVEIIEAARELVEEARLDIRGLSEATIDRRGLTASTRSYDRLGRLLFERSVDAGEHRGLFDAQDREAKHWHESTEERRVFDRAGRVLERHVSDGSASWLAERMTYGEGASDAADRNQRGQLILLEDGAGHARTIRYGAFGEPLEVERTLTEVPGLDPDWSATVALESASYRSTSAFDALGRRARASLPDATEREEDYLRSGPLSELRVRTPDGQTRTILTGAEYNARGQQTKSELGNGVEVTSTYDAQTFRLYQRRAVLPGTKPYQDLRHHYDPVGNLVYLDDLAQRPTATRVINGLTVTAERTYRYDARYQLTEATGRVHNALTQPDFRGDVPTSGSFRGTRRVGLNDGGAVSRYQRTYTYDDGGNLMGWAHGPQGTNPGNTWTNEKWVSPTSNRSFPAYDLNGVAVSAPESKFDARGQLTSLPSVRAMEWSVRGQLRRTVLIERAGGIDDDERYDYAADRVRLRKTTRREVDGSTEIAETIYLDGCELRRITRNGTVLLERWSSHASDGDQRIATIYRWGTDTQARETDDVTAVRTHYHLGTHLGSVALELGASGELLSYEEYFPYGRTAFVAGDAIREIKLRTLRFVGKDQDDATGFYVFQYRYYAPFLGNWISPDPAGEIDGPNRYWYTLSNPSTTIDINGLQASSGTVLQLQGQPPDLPEDPSRPAARIDGEWRYFDTEAQVQAALSAAGGGTYYDGSSVAPGAPAPDLGSTSFAPGLDMHGTGSRGVSADFVPYQPAILGRPGSARSIDPTLASDDGPANPTRWESGASAPRPASNTSPSSADTGTRSNERASNSTGEGLAPETSGSSAKYVFSDEEGMHHHVLTYPGEMFTGETRARVIGLELVDPRDVQRTIDLWEANVEYRAARQARAESVLSALPNIFTFGLWGEGERIGEELGNIYNAGNDGRWGDAAKDAAGLWFSFTPVGRAYRAVRGGLDTAQQVVGLSDELDSSNPYRRGTARGNIQALPINIINGVAFGGGVAGPGTGLQVRAGGPSDRRMSRANRTVPPRGGRDPDVSDLIDNNILSPLVEASESSAVITDEMSMVLRFAGRRRGRMGATGEVIAEAVREHGAAPVWRALRRYGITHLDDATGPEVHAMMQRIRVARSGRQPTVTDSGALLVASQRGLRFVTGDRRVALDSIAVGYHNVQVRFFSFNPPISRAARIQAYHRVRSALRGLGVSRVDANRITGGR